MQREIKFEDYKRSLTQLDLFDGRLNEIKAKNFESLRLIESSRNDIQQAGVTRLLKSSHYGKKKY